MENRKLPLVQLYVYVCFVSVVYITRHMTVSDHVSSFQGERFGALRWKEDPQLPPTPSSLCSLFLCSDAYFNIVKREKTNGRSITLSWWDKIFIILPRWFYSSTEGELPPGKS